MSPSQRAVQRLRADRPILQLQEQNHCLILEAVVKPKRDGKTKMRALVISDILQAELPEIFGTRLDNGK